MALIECKECGNQVSDKAKSCPNCGFEKENLDSKLDKAGKNLQSLGCLLIIFVTIPILLIGC